MNAAVYGYKKKPLQISSSKNCNGFRFYGTDFDCAEMTAVLTSDPVIAEDEHAVFRDPIGIFQLLACIRRVQVVQAGVGPVDDQISRLVYVYHVTWQPHDSADCFSPSIA